MQGLISYAYAYARCKALENNLLNSEIYENMLNAQNVQQIINILLETRYKDLISFFSTKYSGTDKYNPKNWFRFSQSIYIKMGYK